MQEKMFDLTDEVLRVPIASMTVDSKNYWDQIVFFHLIRAHQTLGSVRLTIAQEWYAPSVVLTRFLFELGINLRFLEKNVEDRVPVYLKHSGAVPTLDDVGEIDSQLDRMKEENDHSGISQLLVPDHAWQRLKLMCEELGYLEDYKTMYRLASETAHSGAHGMAIELLEHLGLERRPDWEIPGILITALTYYRLVVDVACRTFPDLAESYQFGATWEARINKLQKDLAEQIQRER